MATWSSNQKVAPETDKNIRRCGARQTLCSVKIQRLYLEPDEDPDLQPKIIVRSDCGISGHRGIYATCRDIKELFRRIAIESFARDLVKICLHCQISPGGAVIPRPLGSALHVFIPNEVLHMEYLYMGVGNGKYVSSYYKMTYRLAFGFGKPERLQER